MASTPKSVKLSTGEVVTFKAYFNHKAERVYNTTLREGILSERMEDGTVRIAAIPLDNFDKAWDACMQYTIESIELGGNTQSFTQNWLDNLHPKDHELLLSSAQTLKAENDLKVEEGKKNS